MDTKNVLVAIDDEKFALAIEQTIKSLRWQSGTIFKVLHAIEATEAVANWPSEQYRVNATELVRKTAENLRLSVPDSVVEEVLVEEFAREAIINEATAWPADLIILGSHGRHGIEKVLLGSVSEKVVADAPCSVIVVRLPKAQKNQVKGGLKKTANV